MIIMPPVEKILLIEPDQPTADLITTTLNSHPEWGASFIDHFRKVKEVLKELSITSYDFILIDCHHLEPSPLEILFSVRALQKESPLILINKQGLERTAIACLKHGADYYLMKDPHWEEELPLVMETVLEENRQKKNLKQRIGLLEQENKVLKKKALLDEETFFYAPPFFKSVVERELKRAVRHGSSLACLVLDVGTDRTILKKIKKRRLSPVYEQLSTLLRSTVRASDIWARLSQNRFAALFPHTTGKEAHYAARRIRSEIAESKFHLDATEIPLSLRWGVVEFDKNRIKDETDFLNLAEGSLKPWEGTDSSH